MSFSTTKEYKRQYYLRNRERIIANVQRRTSETREQRLAYWRERYHKKKEHILAQQKRNYCRNKKIILARNKVYFLKNKTEINAKNKAYYEENREVAIQKIKVWQTNNPHKYSKIRLETGRRRRERDRAAGPDLTPTDRKRLFDFYDNRCLCCGLSKQELLKLGRILAADHVIPLAKDGSNHISNRQPLCDGKNGCNNRKFTKDIDYRKVKLEL